MTAVTDASSTSALGALTSQSAGQTLGKEDFLLLLVAQLQNQDPLNPSDPTEFTAQLAQFSSLEQLTNVNNALEAMATSSGRYDALSFIGNEVVIEQNAFHFSDDIVGLGYRLDGAADQVQLMVKDASGATVALLEKNNVGEGEHFSLWDGTDLDGEAVPPGDYSLAVNALRGGNRVESTSLVSGTVTGVDLNGGSSILVSTAGNFKVNDVSSVRNLY